MTAVWGDGTLSNGWSPPFHARGTGTNPGGVSAERTDTAGFCGPARGEPIQPGLVVPQIRPEDGPHGSAELYCSAGGFSGGRIACANLRHRLSNLASAWRLPMALNGKRWYTYTRSCASHDSLGIRHPGVSGSRSHRSAQTLRGARRPSAPSVQGGPLQRSSRRLFQPHPTPKEIQHTD